MPRPKEARDRDTTLEQFSEYDQGYSARRIFKWLIVSALFIFSIDPFLIYKRTSKFKGSTKFRLYQRRELRIELTKVDQWRSRWRNFTLIVLTYFCVKFSAIIVVQTLTVYKNNFRQPQRTPEVVDEQGLLALISHLLGNPLVGLPGMTIFLYSVFVVSLGHAVLYIPHHYSLKPINSLNIRIWLDAEREFRRIDMTIIEALEMYNQPLESHCLCNLIGWQRHSLGGPHHAIQASKEIQSRIINTFRGRHWFLRPALYTIQWYSSYDHFIKCLAGPILAIFFASIYSVVQLLSSSSFLSMLANYNFFQRLTLIETFCGLGLVIPLILFMIILFLCDCFCQLYLLRNIDHNLSHCLHELRRFESGHIKQQDHSFAICILLKPLIRVSLSIQELKYNAEALTELVSVNMFISGTTCISILLAENLDGQDLYLIRAAIMVGLWLWTNLSLIGCAYVYSCATRLEKVTWSIMAELRRQECKLDWLMFEFQVAEFWRRLIFSKSFSDYRLSIRPFGATLDYNRALQLNFLALSLAAFFNKL